MEINQPKTVSALRGWQWINQGSRYFFAYKSQWFLTLMLLFSFTFFLFALSPLFQLILVVVFPLITAGLAMACADIEKGMNMSFAYLVKAKDNLNRMNIFRYGLLVIVLIIFAQIFSSLLLSLLGVSNQEVMDAVTLLKKSDEITFTLILSSPVLFKFVTVNLLFLLPVMAVNQVAPVLLSFSTITALEALKLSVYAVYKNLSAFVLYALVFVVFIAFVVLFLKLVVAVLVVIFGENSKVALLVYMGLFMLSIISLTALSYCSSFVIFKDLFTGEN